MTLGKIRKCTAFPSSEYTVFDNQTIEARSQWSKLTVVPSLLPFVNSNPSNSKPNSEMTVERTLMIVSPIQPNQEIKLLSTYLSHAFLPWSTVLISNSEAKISDEKSRKILPKAKLAG